MAVGRRSRPSVRFGLQIHAFKTLYPRQVVKMLEVIAFQALRNLVLLTPVDTGRLRASWNVALNTPNTSTQPKRQKSTARGTAAGKKGRAPGILKADVSPIKIISPFSKVWITNNVDYARKINNGMPGGSRQAPDGMIEPTIRALKIALGGRIRIKTD